MDTRYVSKAGRDGWLTVRLESGGEISLPQFLKVGVYDEKGGREYFEILEGAYKGRKASVKRKTASESYLITGITQLPGGSVRFDRAKQALWYGGKGPYSAFSGAFTYQGASFTQVPPGSYPLQVPDAPHSATRPAYYSYADYHKTWFRLGLSLTGSRFLHVGEISEGCVTVRAFVFDPAKPAVPGFEDLPKLPAGAIGRPYPAATIPLGDWDDLYSYLIIRRANDQSVGTLVVQ
jgi:hypothetical protein